MAMFSKRHYEFLAEQLSEACKRNTDNGPVAQSAVNSLIVQLGSAFGADNPQFKWSLFNKRIGELHRQKLEDAMRETTTI